MSPPATVLRAIAAVLAASLLVAGWKDVSYGYDIWYYHLPFAARIAGLMDEASYAFSADNAARFAGFPLLAELLQGLAWRVTGHIEATSFVSLGALAALLLALWRLHGVPLHLSLFAFLAVPLVHIHVTSSYVDLPANAAVTILLLCLWRALAGDSPPSDKLLAGALVAAAAAANTKFQLVPIVTLALAVLFVLALRAPGGRARRVRRAAIFVAMAPVVFATPIKNTVIHHNPVWPVELTVLGSTLPHREKAYSHSPPHLAETPRPIRFLRSALEIDNRPIASQRRWSLDQWAPPDDPSSRMGGYFGAYVLVNLVALGLAVARKRTREARAAGILFAGVTVVAALVPQSHELRYYMHWMLLLVAINLALHARERPLTCAAVALGALAVVAASTGGTYLYASGSTFAEFRARHVDAKLIEAAAPGERLCVAREPFTFLHAPIFDRRKDYAVQEATKGTDCAPSATP